MEKFETYLCPLCYSKHTGKCSKIEWTSSLSPKQEWRLHNGEGDVPEWFIRWSERVYAAAASNRKNEIAEEINSFPLSDLMFFYENNWKAGYKALEEFKNYLLKH